jgi:hypothetical protein
MATTEGGVMCGEAPPGLPLGSYLARRRADGRIFIRKVEISRMPDAHHRQQRGKSQRGQRNSDASGGIPSWALPSLPGVTD